MCPLIAGVGEFLLVSAPYFPSPSLASARRVTPRKEHGVCVCWH